MRQICLSFSHAKAKKLSALGGEAPSPPTRGSGMDLAGVKAAIDLHYRLAVRAHDILLETTPSIGVASCVTGALAPSTSNNLIFSLNFIAAQSLTATLCGCLSKQ